jgi:hypothetical protein
MLREKLKYRFSAFFKMINYFPEFFWEKSENESPFPMLSQDLKRLAHWFVYQIWRT